MATRASARAHAVQVLKVPQPPPLDPEQLAQRQAQEMIKHNQASTYKLDGDDGLEETKHGHNSANLYKRLAGNHGKNSDRYSTLIN